MLKRTNQRNHFYNCLYLVKWMPLTSCDLPDSEMHTASVRLFTEVFCFQSNKSLEEEGGLLVFTVFVAFFFFSWTLFLSSHKVSSLDFLFVFNSDGSADEHKARCNLLYIISVLQSIPKSQIPEQQNTQDSGYWIPIRSNFNDPTESPW